jgi:hypothetical protein
VTGSYNKKIIEEGESNLNYAWKAITASQYLEYERSGSRTVMEGPYGANAKALSALVFAELAEGKGRFVPQIINGVWYYCDMPSWVYSAHLPAQKTKRSLPNFNEQILDLGSCDMASFLSWTYYFFHLEFDKADPIISIRLKKSLQDRILTPYLQRDDYWWQGFAATPGRVINNWNPWCNSNVLQAFLLMEDNPDTLAKAVYKTIRSVDEFLNNVKSDGACEEGPSYWDHAAGKLYDYLQIVKVATNGKVDLFGLPIVKNMGKYIVDCYVGNDWVVNFADASAKISCDEGTIYRYGKVIGNVSMCSFASYLFNKPSNAKEFTVARDFYRSTENLLSFKEMSASTLPNDVAKVAWYPETEVLFLENAQHLFLAAKGGFNNESHNHNDVGTFSFYVNKVPFIIDAGVGTYTRQTFGQERYSIWTMQSNYHNLPMINGVAQPFGAKYKSKNISFDSVRSKFSLDISGAYDSSAMVKKWVRSLTLTADKLTLIDDFELLQATKQNSLNFLCWAKPQLTTKGEILLEKNGEKTAFTYNPSQFDYTVETITLSDKRLSSVWGNEIYRVSLTAKKLLKKGTYKFEFKKL